ncbi:MAG: phage tail assembly protein [Alphaproteobacteria bacterium]|nr:phage tail assembly protein [Alphaproteobacteria bacterium]
MPLLLLLSHNLLIILVDFIVTDQNLSQSGAFSGNTSVTGNVPDQNLSQSGAFSGNTSVTGNVAVASQPQCALTYPLEIDGTTVSLLTVRRPRVADIERYEARTGNETTRTLGLLADLTELAPDTLRRLDADDYQQLCSMVSGFFSVSNKPLPATDTLVTI